MMFVNRKNGESTEKEALMATARRFFRAPQAASLGPREDSAVTALHWVSLKQQDLSQFTDHDQDGD